MALTLEEAIVEFIGRITPTPQAVEAATRRTDHVVSLLQQGFRTGEVYHTGSIHRGTALSGISDADVIVKVDIGTHTVPSSQEVMTAVQRHMSPLHQGTQAREDNQAVTFHYRTKPNIDLVPARFTQGVPLIPEAEFNIPSGIGQWMPTYPKKHDEAMRILSQESKQLIRLIKYWNHKHSKPLQSFHIETIVLNETIDRGNRSYMNPPPPYLPNEYQGWAWAVLQFFSHTLRDYGVDTSHPNPQVHTGLSLLLGRHTTHPIAEIGFVDDYLDADEALPRMLSAFQWARDGWLAAYDGRQEAGIAEFKKVFGDRFPSYG